MTTEMVKYGVNKMQVPMNPTKIIVKYIKLDY